MKFKLGLSLLVLMFCSLINFAQTEITIKKKVSTKIPGMEDLPSGTANPFKDRTSTVYIKGARMRTDSQIQIPTAGMFGGGTKTVTSTTIMQCDKQRTITFNSEQKKYYLQSTAGANAQDIQKAKKGGYVTMTGSVTDTGERAKLFGYEAKHLKQILTITPGKDACMKGSMKIESEGWYADLPDFTCPFQHKTPEFQTDGKCYDEVIDQVKGAITGIALREIKKITTDGQTITMTEEVVSLTKTPLAATLFEPPTNYTAANTLKEIQENGGNQTNAQTNVSTPPTNTSTSSFPAPTAGVSPPTVGEKKAGTIRIGVVMPKVTTPDSKNNPDAGNDIALATRNYLLESLKAENVEVIALESDLEIEAKNRNCDYIFYANITQKRGGGGMFKSMVLQGAIMAGSMMVPGIGGMIASTVASQVMGQTMGKMAKAKDEFALEYKVVGLDKSVLSKATTKKKTEKEGEDVLSPQIQEASKTVLGEITKKGSK